MTIDDDMMDHNIMCGRVSLLLYIYVFSVFEKPIV